MPDIRQMMSDGAVLLLHLSMLREAGTFTLRFEDSTCSWYCDMSAAGGMSMEATSPQEAVEGALAYVLRRAGEKG